MSVSYAESTYQTSNTAIAAYLLTIGFELLGNELNDSGQVVFSFRNSDGDLSGAVHAWNTTNAPGNCAVYYHSYRKLVSIAQRERRLYGEKNA